MDPSERDRPFVPATAPPPYDSVINQLSRNPHYRSSEDLSEQQLRDDGPILPTTEIRKDTHCKSNHRNYNKSKVSHNNFIVF